MSKRIMTKLTALALTMTLLVTVNLNGYAFNKQTDLTPCMTVKSNLPMNHSNHPCNAVYMPNKSWLSWLSNDSKSAHLHFLDLIELLHYSFH